MSSEEYKKKLKIRNRLRRGRNKDPDYCRNEEERIKRDEQREKLINNAFFIDKEQFFRDYPKRFSIEKAN